MGPDQRTIKIVVVKWHLKIRMGKGRTHNSTRRRSRNRRKQLSKRTQGVRPQVRLRVGGPIMTTGRVKAGCNCTFAAIRSG